MMIRQSSGVAPSSSNRCSRPANPFSVFGKEKGLPCGAPSSSSDAATCVCLAISTPMYCKASLLRSAWPRRRFSFGRRDTQPRWICDPESIIQPYSRLVASRRRNPFLQGSNPRKNDAPSAQGQGDEVHSVGAHAAAHVAQGKFHQHDDRRLVADRGDVRGHETDRGG